MSESDEQAKRKKEAEEWRREHMEPTGKRIHNAMIDVRIDVFREAITLLEQRIAELEADKLDVPEDKK